MTSVRTAIIDDAAHRACAYVDASTSDSVFPPQVAIDALSDFTPDLPDDPVDPAAVLDLMDRIGSPATVKSTGGRYFGFVTGGVEPAAAGAAILSGAWDQNGAIPVMSPAAARLDTIASSWVLDLLGLPADACPGFCSGATVANITGVLVARDALLHRKGWNVAQQGLSGSPPLTVVISEEIHASALRALRIAGFGRDQMVAVPTDALGRMDPSQLPDLDDHPLIMTQAGNVNTGYSDPFEPLISAASERNGWVHVDGAFGLWAGASPSLRGQLDGVEHADSWALDCHKWLNVTYDSGVAICARKEDMLRTMTDGAAYLVGSNEDRVPLNLGLQMSQRARGIEIWAAIMGRGRSGVADIIDTHHRQATTLAKLLTDAGADLLAPVALNQILVAFDDDATTEAVLETVEDDGTCWAGGTTWKGQKAMRISVSDTATTDEDIDSSARAIIRCWNRVRIA